MSEESRIILDMLSESKITADEAERLLAALGSSTTAEASPAPEDEEHGQPFGLDLGDLEEQIRARVDEVRRTVKASMPRLKTVIRDAVPDVERIVEEATSGIPEFVEEMTRTFRDAFGEARHQSWHEAPKARAEREFTESTPLASGSRLILDNPRGNVAVETWDQEQVEARVHVKVWATDETTAQTYAEEVRLEVQELPAGVTLCPVLPPRGEGSQVTRCDLDIRLRLPQRLDLDLRTSHGGLVVPDMDGSLVLSGNHGDIRVTSASGDVTVRHHHGALHLNRVGGSLALDAHHTRVHIDEVAEKAQLNAQHAPLSLRRVGGDLVANTHHSPIDVDEVVGRTVTNSHHGPISLRRVGADLTLSTSHSPVDIGEAAGKARLANDHGPIRIRRVGGDLAVQNNHGPIDIGEVAGQAVAKNNYGPVRLERVGADCTVETSRGPVYLGPTGGRVTVRSNRGDILIEGPGGEVLAENSRAAIIVRPEAPVQEAYTLSNDRGNVEIVLPEGSNVVVQGLVRRGRVDTDLPLSVSANGQRGQSVSGQLGEGGKTVQIEVNGGNLRLRGAATA